jgi:phosphoribosyl 1,2-cyclic phosphodiesterase
MDDPSPRGDAARSIEVQTLASGSSGNALLIRSHGGRILVDAGISCRRIEALLGAAGLAVGDLDGVLLTHEHGDHVRGIPTLKARYPDLRVFATPGTARACAARYGWEMRCVPVASGRELGIGDARVTPFRVSHDAAEPVNYRFDWPGLSLVQLTDLGTWGGREREALSGCRVALLESNYDGDMLRAGPYPAHLKRRVASDRGHLSNRQARQLLETQAASGLEMVVLTHLSAENNEPALALAEVDRVRRARPELRLLVAPRHQPSAVLRFTRSVGTAVTRAGLRPELRQGVLAL